MSFSSNVLSIERNGPVGTAWLDRPEKRNAMNHEFWRDMPRAMAELGDDPAVRAIVLAGRGKSFCVGLDLMASQAIGQGRPKAASQAAANIEQIGVTRAFQAGISSVASSPLPVIAAVHGHCLGGGIDLITAAGHVAELVYTGKDIDAARAEKIGLVNDVYPDQQAILDAAYDLANEIAANAPLAVRGTKFILQKSEDLTTEQSLLLNGLWTMATSLNSNDLKEAMKAFMEKRPAEFTGS